MIAGQPDRLLVAFSWCLSMSDRYPERFPDSELLWEFRWVINELTSFPSVPRERIEGAFADMIDRYTKAGSSLRAVWLLGRNVAIAMGDRETAKACSRKWKLAARDSLSDDLVTERVFDMSYLIYLKKYDRGIEIGMPFLRLEIRDERFEPGAFADLLYPLFAVGRLAEAATCHRRGIRPIARKPHEFHVAAAHIDFLCLTANTAAALPLYRRFLPTALKSPDISRQFTFHLCGLMLTICLQREGIAVLKLPLPQEVREGLPGSPGKRESIGVSVAIDWHRGCCETLADEFDARNGNGHHRTRLAEHLKMPDRIRPWPLGIGGSGEGKSSSKHD